jgi:hypothetical protein
LWTEGTAQFALAERLSGSRRAGALMRALDRLRTENGSYFAADTGSLPTGIALDTDPAQARAYFHLPHLGATAWVALAEQAHNPFAHTETTP